MTDYNGSGINGQLFIYKGKSIFLPASGYRNASAGSLTNQGNYGHFWGATQYDSNYAWNMTFNSGNVNMNDNNLRAYGFSVRCVQAVQYTVIATALTGGTVTSSDTYMADTEVTVTATPESDYAFAGWYESGEQVSTDVSYTFTVKGDVTLEARFNSTAFEINGVKWAKFNVDAPGTFAANEYEYGMFYQWNRRTGWPSSGTSVSNWDSSIPSGETWSSDNDPCPTGWHVPTQAHMQSLIDNASNEWTTNYNGSGKDGRLFTYNSKSIFFPASGYRSTSDGSLYSQGDYGYYWSATQSDSYGAWSLYFGSGGVYMGDNNYRAGGFSVRCVQE
jgi:uncharacterized protein (TIGR02145 family)